MSAEQIIELGKMLAKVEAQGGDWRALVRRAIEELRAAGNSSPLIEKIARIVE